MGALRQQPLIPVGFRYFLVLMGLSYVGSDASQLPLPVLVVRAYERRVVQRVKRSTSMVCHALRVSLWGLGAPFVNCTGVPLSYCILLWYLLYYGTSLSSRGSGSQLDSHCYFVWSAEFVENIFLQSRRDDNSVGFSEYSVFACYLVSEGPVQL